MERWRRIIGRLGSFLAWQLLRFTNRTPPPTVRHHRTVPGSHLPEVVWRTTTPAVVEPSQGYVIVEPRRLRMDGFDVLRGIQPAWAYAIPPARDWVRPGAARRRMTVELDRVVSLRHLFEWNYYHFLFDVLGKLALFDQLDLLGDRPVMVGPSAAELPFARELRGMGAFADVNWLVQGRDTYVRAREVTYCRARPTHAERARYVVDALQLPPLPPGEPERKVLLVRRPPSTRTITNLDEVEAITAARGYETVDTAGWPLAEQIELFRRTRSLVAIHGAGMTNMMFRAGNPMNVVELCSDVWTSGDFARTADELGYGFTRLTFPAEPSPDPMAADFRVDPMVLEATLDRQASRQ